MERDVSMTFHRPMERKFINPDRWAFKPRGRFAFVQRWAWRLLLKMGALSNVEDSKTEYLQVHFKASTALRRLMETRAALFEINRKPTRILLGPDVMAEIIADPAWREMAMYNMHASFTAPAGYGEELYGMSIHVVPWMRGIVVLDDEVLRS